MAQLVSPAFKGLNCLICGQQAHGQRFGAISCLPCASFFRRYVIEKWNHKCARGYKCIDNPNVGVIRNCKACRFRRCQNAGMKIKLKNIDDEKLIKEYDQNNILNNFPQLNSFKLNFENYLKSQNKLFSLIYPKLAQQQISIIVPESEESILDFENRSKQFLLEMLNKSFNCFDEMNMQQKLCLLNDCFDQINFLIATYLTIKSFQKNDLNSSNYFFIIYGHILDINNIDKIISRWMMPEQNNKYFCNKKAEMFRRFNLIKNYRQLPNEISLEDFCSLIAIVVCIKALINCSSSMEKSFNSLKTIILNEWFKLSYKTLNSKLEASLHISRLISTLLQLDEIFNSNKNKIDISSFSSLPSAAVTTDNFNSSMHITKINSHCIDMNNEPILFINYMVNIMKCYRRIWDSFYEFPDQYLSKFSKLNELLSSPENILSYYEQFNPSQLPMKDDERIIYFDQVSKLPVTQQHPRNTKAIIVSRLLTIGIFKSLSFFKKLPPLDQEVLICELAGPVGLFILGYISHQYGADTAYGCDGLAVVDAYKERDIFKKDINLMRMASKTFSCNVVPFNNIFPRVEKEEFAVLVSILCSYPIVSSLSDYSRELLYKEQSFYTKILLKHLQFKFGDVKGATRYAECMRLIDQAFICNRKYFLFVAYLETFLSHN